MKFLGLTWMLLAVSAESVTARAAPAVAHPIEIRYGSTEYRVSCRQEGACNTAIARICTKGHYVTAYKPPTEQPSFFDFVCTPGQHVKADEPAKQQAIQVFISPECKDMFYGPDFIDLDANGKEINTEERPKPDYVPWDPAKAILMSYKDPRTSIAIYVESEGRHIAAMDVQGKLLWVRNLWEEQHVFCPSRTPRPVVVSLKMVEFTGLGWFNLKSSGENLNHSFVVATFDSGQYGLLDESTGDFFPKGQN
jgi:hypothetical protein